MREGSYVVHVKKEGYYDVSQSISVDERQSRTIVVELRKLPGQLTISTDPAVDAIITVDDSSVGRAPYGPLELEPGTHSVTVTADRYLPYAQRLTVPGLGKFQHLNVQLVPQWANVEVSSNPSGAAVYQGTTQIGETPMQLELMEGSHAAGAGERTIAGQYHPSRRKRNGKRSLSWPVTGHAAIVTRYQLRHWTVESRLWHC